MKQNRISSWDENISDGSKSLCVYAQLWTKLLDIAYIEQKM